MALVNLYPDSCVPSFKSKIFVYVIAIVMFTFETPMSSAFPGSCSMQFICLLR